MKTISAMWYSYTHFDIPDDVAEYLKKRPYEPKHTPDAIGRWYIRWNKLYYNDKEGIEQEIEGCELQCEMKTPEKIDVVETGEVLYEDK